MSHILCHKLIPMAGGIVSHCFQKAAYSFLVIPRDTSELSNQLLFGRGKQLPKRRSTPSSQHISRVDPMFFKSRHIAKVERVCTQLIVLLCPATDREKRSEFCLTHT